MARILFAWELGVGIGYVDRLSQVAEALAAEGHEPVFVVRDLVSTADFFARKPWIVMQAPLAVGLLHPTQPSFVPGSYADLLAVNNFTNAERLFRLAHAWHMLFLALQPALIVAEYAPVATLAAHGRIPTIAMGHGYILPPPGQSEFPIFDPGAQRFAPPEQLVEAVRAVQQRLGGPVADSVPAVIGGTRHFVTAFAETDPYAGFRTQPDAGPLESIPPPAPPGGSPSFYAYLSAAHPQLRMILQSLVECGLPGAAHIKRITPEIRQYLSERKVHVFDRPPPLGDVTRGAHVVVHHGGAATLAAAMGAGRPQMLWPEVADQQVSASTIDRLGVSVHARRRLTSPAQAARAMRELAQGEAPQRAMQVARTINQRGESGSLVRIVSAAQELIG
ncbi:MAG: nucleotide disphospho-sugar-binding domain-containing protein [Reyranellaceae bacterium]